MAAPDVLIFDLFGTLVFFDDSRVPWVDVAGRRVPMTIAGLPALLEEFLPGVGMDDFQRELRRAGAEISETKRRDGIEIPTAVRFERTLLSLGAVSAVATAAAKRMAILHMDTLARSVVCPPQRSALLGSLAEDHRLALLSNFDDGATARRVLAESDLSRHFEVIVISEEEGLRKPSRAIFERTCARLGAAPSSCLYIGDTFVEDIEGSTAAGLEALWVRSGAVAGEASASPAVGVVHDVDALPAWLAARR